jgi:hypothetical protein
VSVTVGNIIENMKIRFQFYQMWAKIKINLFLTLYHKMSLNPAPASASAAFAAAAAPDAKLTFNINAFNGNTTNFNRCSAPRPKSMLAATPVQPMRNFPSFTSTSTNSRPGMIAPL